MMFDVEYFPDFNFGTLLQRKKILPEFSGARWMVGFLSQPTQNTWPHLDQFPSDLC